MKRREAIVLVVMLVLLPSIIGWDLLNGRGGRFYFSPDTLESKSQSEVLLYDFCIYESGFESCRWPFVEYLVKNGYWAPRITDSPRWLMTSHWNYQRPHGHPQELHRALASQEVWIDWSDKHPELAKVVWPWVLHALPSDNSNREDFVTWLLQNAKNAHTTEEFHSWMDLLKNDPKLEKDFFIDAPVVISSAE
jgi:hypothetical protein